MPSDAFARFLRRLNATGREKGDGFFPADFAGLSAAERAEVRTLLRDAARRGDDTAPGGLALLDGPNAVGPLTELVRELPFLNDARLRAARELWDLTHAEGARRVIVDYLQHPNATTRLVTLGYLTSLPPDPTVAPDLARVVESDKNDGIRAAAGELFLLYSGIIKDIADAYRLHRRFMQAVESQDAEARRAALAQVA